MSQYPIKAVHQLLPSFSPRDAIGNETVLMQQLIRASGLKSEIYAEQGAQNTVATLLKGGYANSLLLYHFSIASTIPSIIASLPVHKVIRYHSITPPWFFNDQAELAARQACSLGYRQIPLVATIANDILADSAHNAAEIAPFAEIAPRVIPVFRDYATLTSCAETALGSAQPKMTRPTLLFVGRIAPNKCQHDLILLLHLAKQIISPDLRLILVGGFFSEYFHKTFLEFAHNLNLTTGTDPLSVDQPDVLIPHNVSDAMMATFYRGAKAFVSLSEHEGFGVPLVEAMHFDLPILAHKAAAVPETVGEAGVLIDKNDWPNTVAALRAVLTDEALRARLRVAMQVRRRQLDLAASSALFSSWLATWTQRTT